jgi:hypothetical protein
MNDISIILIFFLIIIIIVLIYVFVINPDIISSLSGSEDQPPLPPGFGETGSEEEQPPSFPG